MENMNVLYLTNAKVLDIGALPSFMTSFGDNVIIKTDRFDLPYLIANDINYIVSDRTQFLIKPDIIGHLHKRIINLHPSFLPWGRGYHPNYWSIKEHFAHGVTIHFIDEGIDTGDIVAQTRCFYSESETLRDTYDRLRRLMVDLFKSCWPELRQGSMAGMPQNKNEGCLHYKKDFDGHLERLSNGWDTQIRDIPVD
jgi:methionyl-tRNA formyltransferase